MCNIESLAARFPLVCCCCCDSSDGEESKEESSTMKLAPTYQFWRKNTGVAPAIGRTSVGAVSPQRLPSTRLSTGRAVSSAPSIVSSLVTTDPTILRSERKDLAFTVGVKVIPHPDKVAKGGEDAYFVSSYAGGVLGVADGVSGWAEENVDPALFSKELMAHALAAVETQEVGNDPRQLLAKAHSSTVSIGAATAIIAILEKKGILHVANLGDCGLRILRQGKVVYATKPQQHYFDCPYQLSSENAQTADDATVYELRVSEGDTIVMGSDGLFDNVYDSEIESAMQIFGGLLDQDLANRAALDLASLACNHAKDKTYDSPYAKEAILQGHDLPWWYKAFGRKIGGKIDDITVVVGHIVSTPVSTEDEVMSEKHEKTAVMQTEEGSTEEQIALEQQIATSEQISAEEQIALDQQISTNEQMSTNEQTSSEQQISTNGQVSAEEQIALEQQISTSERISAEEQVSTEDQTAIDEKVSSKEQVSAEDQTAIDDQVSSKEQTPAEQVSSDEQISKEEPENQVS